MLLPLADLLFETLACMCLVTGSADNQVAKSCQAS